jgi:hypothetical protein
MLNPDEGACGDLSSVRRMVCEPMSGGLSPVILGVTESSKLRGPKSVTLLTPAPADRVHDGGPAHVRVVDGQPVSWPRAADALHPGRPRLGHRGRGARVLIRFLHCMKE